MPNQGPFEASVKTLENLKYVHRNNVMMFRGMNWHPDKAYKQQ